MGGHPARGPRGAGGRGVVLPRRRPAGAAAHVPPALGGDSGVGARVRPYPHEPGAGSLRQRGGHPAGLAVLAHAQPRALHGGACAEQRLLCVPHPQLPRGGKSARGGGRTGLPGSPHRGGGGVCSVPLGVEPMVVCRSIHGAGGGV